MKSGEVVKRLLKGDFLVATLSGTVLFIGAYEGGLYALEDRGALGIVVWWTIALGVLLALWPASPLPPAPLVAGGLLAAFGLWTGLSVAWAESEERALNELSRALLYLGVFSLVVLVSRRRRVDAWLLGASVAIAAIVPLALVSRLFPGSIEAAVELARVFPSVERRLSYPVEYWNGLATLVALAVPMLVHFATWSRSALVRGLAVAPLPALALTIYLTSSRGGVASAALGALVYIVFTGRRGVAILATVLAVGASAAVIAYAAGQEAILDDAFDSSAASGEGQRIALITAALCLGAGLIHAAGSRILPPLPRMPAGARWGLVAVVLAVAVLGLAFTNPKERFEEFKRPPSQVESTVSGHLLSGSGTGRWQNWTAAVEQFRDEPLRGQGAGSYEAWWAQHRTIQIFVRDAHSLYLETLGELGVVGLVLLLAFITTVVASFARRVRTSDLAARSRIAALGGVFAAWTFEAGIDWMWELTAVTVVGISAAALLTGPATQAPEPSDTPNTRRTAGLGSRVGVTLLALALTATQALPYLAARQLRLSQSATARGDLASAAEHARAAGSLEPWAATPSVQLALVYERAGDLPEARAEVALALERDSLDWRTWLVSARLATKAGDPLAAQRSLERAKALNPGSELFEGL